MKEQIVELLMSKVVLDQQKAEQAVETILGYVKENPQQLTSYLSNTGGSDITDKLKSFFS